VGLVSYERQSCNGKIRQYGTCNGMEFFKRIQKWMKFEMIQTMHGNSKGCFN